MKKLFFSVIFAFTLCISWMSTLTAATLDDHYLTTMTMTTTVFDVGKATLPLVDSDEVGILDNIISASTVSVDPVMILVSVGGDSHGFSIIGDDFQFK